MQTVATTSALASAATHFGRPKLPVRRGSLRRILVCLDHSQFANVALQQAISVAKTFDGAITLLYVLQPPHEAESPRPTDAFGWDIATRQAARYLDGLEKKIAGDSGLLVDSRLEQGHPAERIASDRK